MNMLERLQVVLTGFMQANTGVCFLDDNHRIYICNPAFADMFGYYPEEIEGQSILVLHDLEDSKNIKESVHRPNTRISELLPSPISEGERYTFDTKGWLKGKKKDGSSFDFFLGPRVAFMKDGKVYCQSIARMQAF